MCKMDQSSLQRAIIYVDYMLSVFAQPGLEGGGLYLLATAALSLAA